MSRFEEPSVPADDLLGRAARGEAEAWEALVAAYSGRLFGLLVRQCGDRDLAEELTQATFVKVVRKLGSGYDERGKFEPWLFRIAMNGLRDEMRRRKRQARPMDMSPGAASGRGDAAAGGGWASAQHSVLMGGPAASERPEQELIRDEQVELLRRAVATMSEADREVLHLRHTAGLSFAEIAEALGQPLGTVLARGHRALKKLKALMLEADPELENA